MSIQALIAEIDIVVDSPYPVSLKHLHTICTTCSDFDIATWATQQPCKVSTLSRLVLEARSSQPCASDLITILSKDIRLRDAFLQHAPTLVSDLLQNGSQSDQAVLSLLSHPLPTGIGLPATAENFFLTTFDATYHNPTDESMKELHRLTGGAFKVLLPTLASGVLETLQKRLCKVIGSATSAQDDCYAFEALSIALAVINAFGDVEQDQHSWRPHKLYEYFTGRNATKTLQLIVLKVILAARPSMLSPEARTILLPALDILLAIETDIKCQWCETNMSVLQKLLQKAGNKELEAETQYLTVLFSSRLVSSIAAPALPQSLLSYLESLRDLVAVVHLLSQQTLGLLLADMPASSVAKLLSTVPDVLVSDDIGALTALERILQALKSVLKAEDAADTLTVLGALDWQAVSQKRIVATHPGTCEMALANARKQVLSTLNHIVFATSLATTLPSPQAQLLHSVLTPSNDVSTTCAHGITTKPEVSPMHSSTGSWQDLLNKLLDKRIKSDRKDFEHIFTLRCQDLQDRCENVEQPLRAAEIHAAAQQTQIETLSRQIVNERERNAKLQQEMDQLRKCHEDTVDGCQEAESELEKHIEALKTAEQEIVQLKKTHKTELAAAEERYMDSYLETAVMRAAKQGAVNDLEKYVEEADAKHEKLEQQIQAQDEQLAQARHEIEQLKTALQVEQTTYASTISAHDQAKAAYDAEIGHAESRMSEVLQAHETAKAQQAQDHKAELQALQHKLAALEQKYDNEVSMLKNENTSTKRKYDEMQQELDDVQRLTDDYAVQIEDLLSINKAKDREIYKLRGIRDKMMTAMGLQPDTNDDSTVSDILESRTAVARETRQAPRSRKTFETRSDTARTIPSETRRNTIHMTQRPPLSAKTANTSPIKRQSRAMGKVIEELDENEYQDTEVDLSTSDFDNLYAGGR